MKTITELKQLFEEINKLKSKAPMNTSQFCSALIDSDDDEYMELHYSLLARKDKYFRPDLKMFFGFRQSKEKVHYFLKDKLTGLTDKELINDINEILNDINYCSLEDLVQWLDDLKSGKRNDKNQFVWTIMKSPFVAYHYHLIFDKTLEDSFRKKMKARFSEHGEEGELLLLSKLEENEDTYFQAEIIFLLGLIKGKHKHKTLEYARQYSQSENDYTRDRALIVLGWIGEMKDTEILLLHLLNDTDVNCRAWSASSYMQMWFRQESDEIKEKAFRAYRKALERETDYFVITTILDAIREIQKTKLGISQTALDNLEIEKINTAKVKAIRLLDKIQAN